MISGDVLKYRKGLLIRECYETAIFGSSEFSLTLPTRLKDKLVEAERLSDEREQCQILNELFGDDFEVQEPPKGSSKTQKAKYSSAGIVPASVGA